MNRPWCDWKFRRRVREQAKALAPWYAQVHLGGGIWTRSWNRETLGQWCNAERGFRKMRRFIAPMLPVPLTGTTVLELGTNSAANLVWAIRCGASEAWGIEPDPRYRSQALLVRQCLGLQRQMAILPQLPHGDRLPYGRRADIGLLCAVLRHIPEAERVPTLQRMGKLCKWIIINANGLPDAPDGDSAETILALLCRAGLQVEQMRHLPHVRGLTILARAG